MLITLAMFTPIVLAARSGVASVSMEQIQVAYSMGIMELSGRKALHPARLFNGYINRHADRYRLRLVTPDRGRNRYSRARHRFYGIECFRVFSERCGYCRHRDYQSNRLLL